MKGHHKQLKKSGELTPWNGQKQNIYVQLYVNYFDQTLSLIMTDNVF